MSDLVSAVDQEIADVEAKLEELGQVRDQIADLEANLTRLESVKKILLGEQEPTVHKADASRAEQIRSLLNQGLKPAQIASQLGIQTSYVYAIKRKG